MGCRERDMQKRKDKEKCKEVRNLNNEQKEGLKLQL